MTGSWARARWSGACTEREAGVRPVALARGPSWPGGGSSRHPYPRPAPARDPTSFCLWNKTGKWYARLDHPGRRAEERSFQKDEPRPQQASAQPGRLLRLVGLRRPQRPRPCPSHRADFPGGGRFNGWRQDCSQRPGVARPLPEAVFPDPQHPSVPRVPLLASKFPPGFAS